MSYSLLAVSGSSGEDLSAYLPVALAMLIGGAIAMGLVGLVGLIGTRRKSHMKSMSFEAGSIPIGEARRRVRVEFYVVALLFIVFDLETVFLLLWAPIFREPGMAGYLLGVMSFFLLLLVVGLAYEWKKGALDWNVADEDDADPTPALKEAPHGHR